MFTADTEILTSAGWVKFPDLTINHKVLAVDMYRQTCDFERPENIVKVPLSSKGKILQLEGKFLNFAVTESTRLLTSNINTRGNWKTEIASEAFGKDRAYLTSSMLSKRELPDIGKLSYTKILKILPIFLRNGSFIDNKTIGFRLKMSQAYREINEHLATLDILKSSVNGFSHELTDSAVVSCLKSTCTNSDGRITFPDWLLTVPTPLFYTFIQSLRDIFGATFSDTSFYIHSSDKELLSNLQALLHINGMGGQIRDSYVKGSRWPHYRLSISEKCFRLGYAHTTKKTGTAQKEVSYEGFVYSAIVSTAAVMVRRKDKPVIISDYT